jgi:hypothetical protein
VQALWWPCGLEEAATTPSRPPEQSIYFFFTINSNTTKSYPSASPVVLFFSPSILLSFGIPHSLPWYQLHSLSWSPSILFRPRKAPTSP